MRGATVLMWNSSSTGCPVGLWNRRHGHVAARGKASYGSRVRSRPWGWTNEAEPACPAEEPAEAAEAEPVEASVEPAAKPDGERFELKANASDAFIATVRVVDKEGRWCPFADNQLRFEVEGEGVDKGSYNFYVTEGKPLLRAIRSCRQKEV